MTTSHKTQSSKEKPNSAFGWSKLQVGLTAGAAALAGAAIFNTARAKRTEREHPPRGHLLRVDGVDLHYVDSGTPGPTVLLLHGNGTTLEDWFASTVFQKLSETARVIAVDRPGFGYSSRPRTTIWTPTAQANLIALALASLGADHVTVVGHSFATQVTVALASQHPELVESIVLMSGYYYPSVRADVVVGAIPAVPIVGDIDRYTMAPLFGQAMQPLVEAKLFDPAAVAPSWQAFPFAMTLRPSQLRAAAAEAALMVPSAASLVPRYALLALPVTVVSGEGDRIVDHTSQSARLASELPQAKLITIGGVGHMVHYSATERVVQAIEQSLRQRQVIDEA